MNELIVFTHNDLDALGCMLNLEYRFPKVPKKYFHTNYGNIKEITAEILDYQKKNGCTHIVMPDVSFSDNKESLRQIYHAFKNCTHIDHHLYPDGFWDEFPNMKVVWDKSKCATLLCNEYLGNKGQNEHLDQLSFIIDIYDLWQIKSPYFDVSQHLNEYFWRFGTTDLCKVIVDNDYKLPANFKQVISSFDDEFTAAMADYESRQLIQRGGEITFAFISDWFNQMLIREHRDGKNFVVGINQYGIVRVRVNQDAPYGEKELNQIRLQLCGTENTGHMHAFTYKIPNVSFDKTMAEVQKIVRVIGEACA